jgi:hypothetical protein
MFRCRSVAEIHARFGTHIRHDHEIAAGAEGGIEDRPEGRLHQIGMRPANALLLAPGQLARRKPLTAHMARDVAGPYENQILTQHDIRSLCPAWSFIP